MPRKIRQSISPSSSDCVVPKYASFTIFPQCEHFSTGIVLSFDIVFSFIIRGRKETSPLFRVGYATAVIKACDFSSFKQNVNSPISCFFSASPVFARSSTCQGRKVSMPTLSSFKIGIRVESCQRSITNDTLPNGVTMVSTRVPKRLCSGA